MPVILTATEKVSEQPITFTLSDAYTFIIAVCGIIAAVWGVAKIIAEMKKIFSKHEDVQDQRINNAESNINNITSELNTSKKEFQEGFRNAMDKYEKLIEHYWETKSRHDYEIGQMQRGIFILLKAQQANLNHELYGNHVDHLKKSVEEINDFIDDFSTTHYEMSDEYERFKKEK